MKRLDGATEMLDGPLDGRWLEGNLRDLERVNRWLGGANLSWRAVEAVRRRSRGATHMSLLDVGTGAADIPRHLLRRAGASPLRLAITATDMRAEIVSHAQARSAGVADLALVAGPGDRLDFPTHSFDIVHSSMLLHHHEPHEARPLLAEMRRVARRAVIVNDLDRRRPWWVGALVLSRMATGNRYTRHDGPLSVRRAYRPNEVSALAAQVGLREVARLWARPAYRYAIAFVPA